jgi:MFS-type transporter involved in bile tolerance (Atg22 family)
MIDFILCFQTYLPIISIVSVVLVIVALSLGRMSRAWLRRMGWAWSWVAIAIATRLWTVFLPNMLSILPSVASAIVLDPITVLEREAMEFCQENCGMVSRVVSHAFMLGMQRCRF